MIVPDLRVFAHSVPGSAEEHWETLRDHALRVAERASANAATFGWGAAGRALGALHDIGKVSPDFQAYIRAERGEVTRGGVDHSTAGARTCVELYGPRIGKLLAFCIAGHHAGLADAECLKRRLDPARTTLPDYAGWDRQVEAPTAPEVAHGRPPQIGGPVGFREAFFTRMLFSALVDADFIETERFYAEREGRTKERGGFAGLSDLGDRLRARLLTMRKDDTEVNRLRARVLDYANSRAELSPGLFTLTVPTGGGKTLTSLSFALEHAQIHGLRRVVYVIPFTSIIEQTAAVFRDVLGSDHDVLEHHSSFDWETALPRQAGPAQAEAGHGLDAAARLRRAAENWDSPVIVTTAVQAFESLFANRTSRCRKLHNLASSVIVLDEVQTLPLPLLHPCLAALGELARNYGASIILCTATQPALRLQDGFKAGLDIPPERELAPDPPALYDALKRVQVERRDEPTPDETIADRFGAAPQMLCIVNSRAHAYNLHGKIAGLPGATHLSTLMCPKHRRAVLARVRAQLGAGQPVRLVATSLIEAGVDVDFPEVWRATAGLDQIAQAAGRCNREGSPTLGRVVVFHPAEHKAPHNLRAAQSEAEGVLNRHSDPLTPAAIEDYFRQIYWTKGEKAFDQAKLDGRPFPIMPELAERARALDFPFESIARAFRMIDEAMSPVVVPWDDTAKDVLKRVGAMDRPLVPDLRRLQQYVVPVPTKARADWLAAGAIVPVSRALGDTLLTFTNLAHYDPQAGLRLGDPTHRSAEDNVFS